MSIFVRETLLDDLDNYVFRDETPLAANMLACAPPGELALWHSQTKTVIAPARRAPSAQWAKIVTTIPATIAASVKPATVSVPQ
jgi:hypothetical protein